MLFVMVTVSLLAACGGSSPPPVADAVVPTLPLLATEEPTPTATATPTPTLTPSITPTASETPLPPNPLQIEVMRQQVYPGSDITFEETLAPGPTYDNYVVSYQSEGNTIYALMTVPFGEPPEEGWPVIIFNHGYIPPEVYRTTERYEAYVDNLARHGYIVFKSDYRGHGFSEGEASGGYSSPAYTVDVINGMESVKRLPYADPDRVGMWGHSMGGHITLRSMVIRDDIRAGVIWAGVVVPYEQFIEVWFERDLNEYLTATPANQRSNRRGSWFRDFYTVYGMPGENPTFWQSISPNYYLEDLSGPIQLHHGTADTSVPYAVSQVLAQQLTDAGQYSELNRYEGDDHNISQSFGVAMSLTIQFFNEHVKGAE
jgi:dipeptidyl aminopeptidase/acylaminoacyl peptidase